MRLTVFLAVILGGCLGFAGSFLSWGEADGFHGVGFPFAVVYWDQGKDYPNVWGYGFNIVCGVIGCLLLVLAARWVMRLIQRTP
jgi:hypothetical protein